MAAYTVSVIGACAGGAHIALNLKRDGTTIKRVVFHKDELLTETIDMEEALKFFLRQAVKKSGATTLTQAKAAVEAASWEL